MESQKKYQIFVSSTFEDLKVERNEAFWAILKLEHIPMGMECFTASSRSQLDTIKEVLNDIDYLIVIVAHKYGTLVKGSSLSYTETEYDYAISKDIPVLSFIKERDVAHANRECFDTGAKEKSLNKFIEKLEKTLRANGQTKMI